MPKKKFTFGSRAKNAKKKEKSSTEQKQASEVSAVHDERSLYIKDLKEKEVVVTAEELEGKDNIVLENLSNVRIVVPFVMKVAFLKSLRACEVLLHSVQGSCFFDKVTDSKLMMASQQIRIHHTSNSTFHLLVKSNPIIEHSSHLAFGDMTKHEKYSEEMKSAAESCGLTEKNMWNQVNDFNWLK